MKKSKKFESEKELGDVFIAILKKLGYEYWCEVETCAGIIDIVGYKDNKYYTFHLKQTMSNKVLEQAYKTNVFNTYNYCVVPQTKNSKNDSVQEFFINKFDIGIIRIHESNIEYIEKKENFKDFYFFEPTNKYNCEKRDITKKLDIKLCLFDSQKNDVCGVKGGGYDTAFKRSLRLLKEYHIENEYVSLTDTWKKLREDLHWGSVNSFKNAMSTLSYLDIVKDARSVMMDKKL